MNYKQTSPRVASIAALFLGQSQNELIKAMAASLLSQAKKEEEMLPKAPNSRKVLLIVKK